MKTFRVFVRNVVEMEKPQPKPEPKKRVENTLPPDTYTPILEEVVLPLEIESEAADYELHFNCSRFGDYGLPYVDVRLAVLNHDQDKFSGKTKKGVNFPVEQIDEVIEILCSIKGQLREKRLV